jgi:hypothetical protein
MYTYPSSAIWGAVSTYPLNSTPELVADFTQYAHDKVNKKEFKAVAVVQTNGTEMAMTVQVDKDGIPRPPMTSTPAISHLEKVGSTHDVVNEVIAAALESTARTSWHTLTTKVDTYFLWDLYQKANETFKQLKQREGFVFYVSSQALQKSFIEKSAHTPIYNALRQSGDDLVCAYFYVHVTLQLGANCNDHRRSNICHLEGSCGRPCHE